MASRITHPYLRGDDIAVDDVAMFLRANGETPLAYEMRVDRAVRGGVVTVEQGRRLIAYDRKARGISVFGADDVQFGFEKPDVHFKYDDPNRPVTSKFMRWWTCADLEYSGLWPDSLQIGACKAGRYATVAGGVMLYVLAMWILDKASR